MKIKKPLLIARPVNIERRKHPRFPIDLRAEYRGPNDARRQTGRVLNVSGSENVIFRLFFGH